jgi:hypothetical protein
MTIVVTSTPRHLYVHNQPANGEELITLDIPDHMQKQGQGWWDNLADAVKTSVQTYVDNNPPV